MVKDIPIRKELLKEFEPFLSDKRSLAKLFDDFDFCTLCNDHKTDEDMPSQTKEKNSLDKYFVRVNSKKGLNDITREMGKNNTKNNAIHKMSSSSESEIEKDTLKDTNQKCLVPIDENSGEGIEFDSAPSKPIIAAMNALGKLKQGIAEVNVEDNSSRDSTALVIDEEQLEPEEEQQSSEQDEPPANPLTNRNSPLKPGGSHKPQLGTENDTLSFSQFLNTSKTAPAPPSANKFSTSTPVESAKGTKRKRNEGSETAENSAAKKSKDRHLEKESNCSIVREDTESLIEIKNLNEGDCPLFVEDLNSDEELYVVQCPKHIDLERSVGKQLDLNGETVLKFEDSSGKKQPIECFSQKDTMGRHINLILPSKNEGVFKFGVYQLNGSVVISEGIDGPEERSSDNEETIRNIPTENVKPQVTLETKKASVEKQKKHRKKRESSDKEQKEEGDSRITFKEELSPPGCHQIEEIPIKKKKKKKEKEKHDDSNVANLEEVIEPVLPTETPLKKKKKKKHREHDWSPVECDPNEDSSTGKKKKKRDREKNEDSDVVKVEPITEPILYEDAPLKKKKKKKHHDQEFLPQECIPVEESSIKKKKRRTEKENNDDYDNIQAEAVSDEPILSAEEPSKKKKKEKYLDKDTYSAINLNLNDQPEIHIVHQNRMEGGIITINDDEMNHLKLSTFIETDTQHIKKKKKKKKKKEREKSEDE